MSAKRYFADSASVNTPAARKGVDASADQVAWSKRLTTLPVARGMRLMTQAYSVRICRAQDATTTARVWQPAWAAAQQNFGVPHGTTIPWNPGWHLPAEVGNDRIICIVDEQLGKVWELWMVQANCSQSINLGNLLLGMVPTVPTGSWPFFQFNPRALSVASVNVYTNLYNRTDDPTRIGPRGCGLDKLAAVVRAEEVKAGEIRHVVNMTCPHPSSGPKDKVGYAPFRAPATRLEHENPATLPLGGVTTVPLNPAFTVPSGATWQLNWTREQITAYVNQYIPADRVALRITMDVLLGAMADYGVMVTETGGQQSNIGIETDGVYGDARLLWKDLGISSDAPTEPHQQLLANLLNDAPWLLLNCYPPQT